MRSTLVFPPFRDDGLYNMPPLGIMRLSSVLKAAGQEVTLRDYIYKMKNGEFELGEKLYDQVAADILATEPKFVGFSVQCTTYPSALNVAKRIKRLDDSIVIGFGGHNTSFLDTVTVEKYPWIDLIVRGEGEETIVDLVKTLEQGGSLADVLGITWQKDGKGVVNEARAMIADLDALPYPDYGAVASMAEYQTLNRMSHRTALLDAGRGCPYKCVYCSENILWNYKARMRSVPSLIEELSWLKSEHGVDKFLAAYDLFTAKRRFVVEFCEALLDADLQMGWHCICRLDGVDSELLALMSKAGCDSLCYGADSGSAETLKFIKKSIREDLVFPNILATKKAKIVPTLSFVIGFPEEKPADLDRTLDLATRSGMLGDNNPLLQMVTVLAGTPLIRDYEDRLVRGFDTYFSTGLEFNPIDNTRLAEDEALITGDRYTFASFYNIDPLYLDLDVLHCLQRNFPLLVFLFSRSLYLLNREVNPAGEGGDPRVGYLDLFNEYMGWLQEAGRGQWEYGIHQALEYFPEFCHYKLDGQSLSAPYLWDVLDYELLAARMARVPKALKAVDDAVSTMEAQGTLADAVITWSPEVWLAEFAWPLDRIFEVLKETGIPPRVAPERCTLVLSMRHYELSTQSVSPAVAEVLALVQTQPLSVAEVIQQLEERHPDIPGGAIVAGVQQVVATMLRRGVLQLSEESPAYDAVREVTPGLRFV